MEWEFSILYALQDIHNPILDKIMLFISYLGNNGRLWLAIGIVCLFFRKHRKMGVQVFLSLMCTYILGNLILKNIFARPRPCDIDAAVTLLLSRPHGYSFPSGHSINSMVAAVALFLNNKKIGVPALIIATLIGFSRLYLFVHFPTDVLGGFLIAILVAIAIDWGLRQIQIWKTKSMN